VYWFCTKFGKLIIRKIIKIVATRCQILRPKCTKFDFGWGSAPDPAGGAYSAPPDPLAGFRGPTSKGEGKGGRGREGRERGRHGRGGVDPQGFAEMTPLVHWPLMSGLLHLVQQGGDWAGPQPSNRSTVDLRKPHFLFPWRDHWGDRHENAQTSVLVQNFSQIR